MTHLYTFNLQSSFNLDDPYVGVVIYVKENITYFADNFQNYLPNTRHTITTP